MMKVVKYNKEYKLMWDDFLDQAKNSHFIFKRDYMDYHQYRFLDFSLLVFDDKEKLVALLPANKVDDILYSHQGLTFGGFIVGDRVTTELMLLIWDVIKNFLLENSFSKIIYKCIPYIYHKTPAEEDRYALFVNNAKLIRRDVTSTISLDKEIRYSKGRKWSINKAKKEFVSVVESFDYDCFWKILTEVLESQHGKKPVHSLEEIEMLAKKFPNNIKLFLALKEDKVISGAVIYENEEIVHTQYLANSQIGRECGGLDYLLDHLVKNQFSSQKKYFDFGISNEGNGKILNLGLISQKEGFGAKAVVHDFYEICLI